jgi:hypothetical protein
MKTETNGVHVNGTGKHTAPEPVVTSYDAKAVLLEEWRDIEIKCSVLPPFDPWDKLTEIGDQAFDMQVAPVAVLAEGEFRRAARAYLHKVNAYRLKDLSKEEMRQSESVTETLNYELRRGRRITDEMPHCAPDIRDGAVRRIAQCDHSDDLHELLKRLGALKT